MNFWQPTPTRPVRLTEGALFLFKLKARFGGWIVGGGYYAHFTPLPATIAWETFETMNGAPTFDEMAARVRRYRVGFDVHADQIGCMALLAPFFFPPDLWVRPPSDWPISVQRGKTYDSTMGTGADLWERVGLALVALPSSAASAVRESSFDLERYGEPVLVAPRLGQGTFRAKVIDAYERRCVVTNERTLPVLQAAHIRPYALSGPHAPENGLLLRSDLHTLFDRGYVTVTPALELRVSPGIKAEFENGRDYYALDGRAIRLPARGNPPPAREYLEWHADTVFRG